MKRIDIIGAPGVGKTTLMEKMTSGINGYEFITREEALKRSSKLTRINRFDALTIRYYFQTNKNEASRRFVNSYPDSDYCNSVGVEHLDLIRIKAQNLYQNGKYSPKERLHSFNTYQSLLKELYILHTTNPGGMVIYDESISHLISLQGLTSLLGYTSSSYLYPTGVIFLDCTSELIYSRLKTREKLNSRHANLNDQELREDISNLMKETRQKSKHLERIGVPVLYVNAANDLISIFQQVTDWLDTKNLQRESSHSKFVAI